MRSEGRATTLILLFSILTLKLALNIYSMFDFQKLDVYHKAKFLNKEITNLLHNKNFDRITNDQLRRASFSIMLNIAEGSSRFSNRDRKNFLTIARGSAFECVAILEYLADNGEIDKDIFDNFYKAFEEISKMLYALIKKLENNK